MKQTLKVGDILVGMHHYTMTYPKWYKIIKVTEKQARAIRLFSVMAQPTDGGFGQMGYEVPSDEQMYEEEHIIRNDEYGLCTGSGYSYTHLEKWNGEAIFANHMD